MQHSTSKLSTLVVLAALLCAPASASAQSILKTAGNFTILGNSTVAFNGPAAAIANGNIGSRTNVTGAVTVSSGYSIITPATDTGLVLTPAITDLGTAYTGLAAMAYIQANDFTATPTLGGRTLLPGIYHFNAAAQIVLASKILILNANHQDNAVWVFQVGTALTTCDGAQVQLINAGANPGIFWVVGSDVTIGANNVIMGNYLAGTGAITFGDISSGGGRALALAGGVTSSGTITGVDAKLGGNDLTGGLAYAPNGTSVVLSNGAPTITTQPAATSTVFAGGSVSFAATASGNPAPTFQWRKSGANIAGATSATYTINPVAVGDAGSYDVVASNGILPNATSNAAVLAVNAPASSSRIVNFSGRALSGPGDQTLIVGFVVSGDGKHVLVRGIGPTLASFGLSNVLIDPMLTLYGANGVAGTNDNWQIDVLGQDQSTLIAATTAQVGAFALPLGSKDSALLCTVNTGPHTTSLVRLNSTTGIALTEIYDTDPLNTSAHLINVSARMNVTGGAGTLIVGFVIAGNAAKTVLIRGTGPGLTAYGVSGVLADPMIAVYSGGTQIATDDNWETGTSTAAQIIAASAQVGAFPLVSGSKDAALLITLQPGAYTVLVTGVGNTSGVALVEVYDTQ